MSDDEKIEQASNVVRFIARQKPAWRPDEGRIAALIEERGADAMNLCFKYASARLTYRNEYANRPNSEHLFDYFDEMNKAADELTNWCMTIFEQVSK